MEGPKRLLVDISLVALMMLYFRSSSFGCIHALNAEKVLRIQGLGFRVAPDLR